jgi:hypothetical protein
MPNMVNAVPAMKPASLATMAISFTALVATPRAGAARWPALLRAAIARSTRSPSDRLRMRAPRPYRTAGRTAGREAATRAEEERGAGATPERAASEKAICADVLGGMKQAGASSGMQ